ncbi:hypothetical protein Q0S19_13065 [Stenotrophomonas indicatrix]|nr:hypothetical protein [Stenotrophomonas indicatrix]MDN8645396.1 hypothetical protein [Stenotrophomonas indicatrix]
MCYSAQIEAAYQKLVRMTGTTVSLQVLAIALPRRRGSVERA